MLVLQVSKLNGTVLIGLVDLALEVHEAGEWPAHEVLVWLAGVDRGRLVVGATATVSIEKVILNDRKRAMPGVAAVWQLEVVGRLVFIPRGQGLRARARADGGSEYGAGRMHGHDGGVCRAQVRD